MTRIVVLGVAVNLLAGVAAAQSTPSLDYEYFKTRVQPIFVARRAGHARCISCHASGTPLRLQPLAPGATTWSEEDSRKNFEAVKRVVAPGNAKSKLLMHPLAEKAGGDFFHNGGKHWTSQNDPEWQTLKTFVMGTATSTPASTRVVIVQTNSAGDNVHVIDPATNAVIGEITGIEANHGAAVAPDGSRIYISNESLSTLDVVDGKTLKVVKQIPLSAHPNNLAVGRDGRRVYVGIIQAPGGVDVIDTATLQRVKTLPTQGTIHNVYATPDGRFIVAGSIAGKTINVFDAATETPAWTLELDLGIRPMTFSTNPDGSTKWLFTQLTGFNGFAVVDFATHKEIRRITNPDLPPGRSTVPEGSDPSHGMAVTADQKTLVVCSRLNNALYSYSLPDLTVTGTVFLGGKGAAWVTLTPDGRKAYVANAVTDDVSVVDVATMKEVALIPVGFVPKRNTTGVLQQYGDPLPRTADGHPDLQGIWDFRSATPLERPARFAGKEFMTDEDVRAYEKLALEREDGRPPDDARGLEEQSVHPVWWLDYGKTVIKTHRTSLIVDPAEGKIPPLTEEGRKRAAGRREAARSRGPADDPEVRPLQERCITWGVPQGLLPGAYNNNLQIVQTPGAVALFTEMIHNARSVPLDGRPHAPASVRSWNGDPRGHWEGDTLVVDSTNFSEQTSFRGASANLHLVERFTLVDANTLEYRFTVDDPTTWTRSWTVAYPMIRTQDRIYEYACHEANYGLRNTLAAARAEEKK